MVPWNRVGIGPLWTPFKRNNRDWNIAGDVTTAVRPKSSNVRTHRTPADPNWQLHLLTVSSEEEEEESDIGTV